MPAPIVTVVREDGSTTTELRGATMRAALSGTMSAEWAVLGPGGSVRLLQGQSVSLTALAATR